MDAHTEQLAAQVLSLPTDDRAALAHRLIASLDADERGDADDEGHVVALRRLDDIERGAVEPIPEDELFHRVRRRLAK
jgi:putative addiction module component (TIGR02574 family)